MTKKEQIIELLDKYGNETDIFKAFITKDEFSDLADDLVKLFAIPDVSNWGEMKLACKYSKKHDKFTACLHKDTDPAMICFAPAHCPMIKKWSKCAFNRPDC